MSVVPRPRALGALICILMLGVLSMPHAGAPRVAAQTAPAPKPCESYVWQPSMIQIGADLVCKGPAGENLGFDGTGVVVGSIDTGVDINHPNAHLSGNYDCAPPPSTQLPCWSDPVSQSPSPIDVTAGSVEHHGTTAMRLAVGRNGWGVAPGAEWISCKGYRHPANSNPFDDHEEVHDKATIKACLNWYLQRLPDVVFSSIPLRAATMDQEITTLLNALVAQNVVVVVSTGNDSTGNSCDSLTSPALNPNVISVGNVYRQGDAGGTMDAIYPESGRGGLQTSLNKPDLVAPGTAMVSPSGSKVWTGTSMATPHVAGVVALMLSARPTLTPAQVKATLQGTAKRIPTVACQNTTTATNVNPVYGWGRVQAVPAVMSLTAPTTGLSAALYNCGGGYGVIKGGRYWYRTTANSIWQTGTLTSTYGAAAPPAAPPKTGIDSAYINRYTGTEVVIQGSDVWTRSGACGGTLGGWSKSTLAAYYGNLGTGYASLNGPTSAIDAAYDDKNGGVTIIKGGLYWFYNRLTNAWYTGTLTQAYSLNNLNSNASLKNVPATDIDTAYVDHNGHYTVIRGSQYWYRQAGSLDWYTNTLDSAYYGQTLIPLP